MRSSRALPVSPFGLGLGLEYTHVPVEQREHAKGMTPPDGRRKGWALPPRTAHRVRWLFPRPIFLGWDHGSVRCEETPPGSVGRTRSGKKKKKRLPRVNPCPHGHCDALMVGRSGVGVDLAGLHVQRVVLSAYVRAQRLVIYFGSGRRALQQPEKISWRLHWTLVCGVE